MHAVMPWFDATHGRQRIACMIEQGHIASERLAARLGFTAYAAHQQPEEKPLVLYERL
jgi:RimJ/RimL family protein N-acetyltransferase